MSRLFQVQGKQSLPVSHAGGGAGPGVPLFSLTQSQDPAVFYFGVDIPSRLSRSCGDGTGSTHPPDLEMNEDEIGSWHHVFYKLTSQLRRKLLGTDNVGLPQTIRYNSFN